MKLALSIRFWRTIKRPAQAVRAYEFFCAALCKKKKKTAKLMFPSKCQFTIMSQSN